jgi:hypothetical protein
VSPEASVMLPSMLRHPCIVKDAVLITSVFTPVSRLTLVTYMVLSSSPPLDNIEYEEIYARISKDCRRKNS